MEFDGEIASFKVLNEKVTLMIFNLVMLVMCLILYCSKILRDPTKKIRWRMRVLCLMLYHGKKMVKKKKTKVGRPLVKQVASYMYWLRRQPP